MQTLRNAATKRKEHVFTWRVLSWYACTYCGLMRLRNAATDAAIRRGCEWHT